MGTPIEAACQEQEIQEFLPQQEGAIPIIADLNFMTEQTARRMPQVAPRLASPPPVSVIPTLRARKAAQLQHRAHSLELG